MEIDEAFDFQLRWRVVRRVGSAIGALLVVAGLAGVFGTGPTAHATKTGPGGLHVEYDRFLRTTASTTIQLTVPRAPGRVRVAVSQNYLNQADVSQVEPEPERVSNVPGWRVYTIDQRGPGEVDLSVTPLKVGVRTLTLWVPGTGRIALKQVVWP